MTRLIGVLFLVVSFQAHAQEQWYLNKANSSIIFKINVLFGEDVKGEFTKFDGFIVIDTETGKDNKAIFQVYTDSISMNYKDHAELIKSLVFFDVQRHPLAVLDTRRFVINQNNTAEVVASLMIKESQQDVPITFTFKQQDDNIVLIKGKFTFRRSDFKLGIGRWSRTLILKDKVIVEVKLTLKKEL